VEPELAELYPVRAAVPWAEEGDRVVVLLPKRLDPVSRALRAATHGPAHLRVPLDDIGSMAFRLADGSRTAAQLAEELERAFGERAGPRARALAFLGTLARNGLVLLARAPSEPGPAPAPRATACPRCGAHFHTADPGGTRLRCPACQKQMRA
jgi:hypothetical protein